MIEVIVLAVASVAGLATIAVAGYAITETIRERGWHRIFRGRDSLARELWDSDGWQATNLHNSPVRRADNHGD